MYISVLSFKFDNFEDILSAGFDFAWPDSVISASEPQRRWIEKSAWAEDANGNKWTMRLYLDHGDDDDDDDDEEDIIITVLLEKEKRVNSNPSNATTKFSVILRDANGSVAKERAIEDIERQQVFDEGNNILVRGTLHFDLVIQPEVKVACSRVSSQNTLVTNMRKLLESGDMADVWFNFPQGDCCSAHRFVLTVNAPEIIQLFEDTDTIPIQNSNSDIFRCMLHYIYGGSPEKDFVLEHALDIIDAANCYGVEGLKLEAEAALVESRSITAENVVKHILFADATQCALLKEYAISVFAARSKDVMNSESFLELARSPELMKELMMHIVDYGGMVPPIDNDDMRTMSVITLRKRLEEKGMDIDGSKEMLIARLESSA